MDLSSLISQLKQVKDQLGSNFEELPFSSFQLEEQESQQSHHHHSSSSLPSSSSSLDIPFGSFQSIDLDTERLDQEYLTSKKTYILDGQDNYTSKQVIVKVFTDAESAAREYEHLKLFLTGHGTDFVVRVFGEGVWGHMHSSHGRSFFGVVMEKGLDKNLQAYLEEEWSKPQKPSFNELQLIGAQVINVVDQVHKKKLVWNDCKLANFVRVFNNQNILIKAIDLEHATSSSSRAHRVNRGDYGFTPRYAAPEVIRWSYGTDGRRDWHSQHGKSYEEEEEEESGQDRSFRPTVDVDMWCLGCCLLEIHTGRDLVEHLGYGREEEVGEDSPVVEIFSNSDTEITEEIQLVLDNEFKADDEHSAYEGQPRSRNTSDRRHIGSLLRKLLTVNVLSRDGLDTFVDESVDELVPDMELREELKDILVSVLEADLSNDDQLADSIHSALERLLVNEGEGLKCKLKLLMLTVVELKKSRRMSMAQVKAHAYMTGRAGTTTMRGKRVKRNVDSSLSKLERTMSRIEARLGSGHEEGLEDVMREYHTRMMDKLDVISEQLQEVSDYQMS